ncbi:hypothetical protein P43SY_004433 [Pythium insidiosum]|uniref:Guanylate cyclase domain-containing protein n=1 Tax=Pythium insidiosum TaxID=114742 RepID=A0AAD5QEA7_PYTIN|nr:hypothetical protein P43SY_004433 [Pythium insidiosum]
MGASTAVPLREESTVSSRLGSSSRVRAAKPGLLSRLLGRHRVRQAPGEELQAAEAKSRVLYVNDVRRTQEYADHLHRELGAERYHSNVVRTSKYSLLNFIPKSLFEQFRRVANFYFLIISLLQLFTDLSPTNEYSTIGPLAIVLFATMVKEGMEDRARHRQDHIVNHQKVQVLGANPDGHAPPGIAKVHDAAAAGGSRNNLTAPSFQPIFWKNLRVGHVVKLHDKDQVPADIVLLFSSHEDSEAMCETSSLDGESNLKVRHCIKWGQLHPRAVQDFGAGVQGEIRCELPNKRLYSFDGVLRLSFMTEQAKREMAGGRPLPDAEEIPISIENVMLRGMKLCNTKWVIGVVVGAGNDSKLVQNMKAIPSKFSRLDRIANRCIFLIFSVLFAVCCISSVQSALFSSKVHSRLDFAKALPFIDKFSPGQYLEAWITYLILYNNMVPISLYISLEVVKWYQARRIENDPRLRCKDSGLGVTARTSNVNEDLGQIKYIFSDKTGTLTRNQMLFKVCSIGGIIYDGSSMELRRLANADSTELASAIPSFTKASSNMAKNNPEGTGSSSGGARPSVTKDNSHGRGALLNAAIEFDCVFEDRIGDLIQIRLFGERETFRLLALNEFDSVRKCMSVVVQQVRDDKAAQNSGHRSSHTDDKKEAAADGEADEVLVFCKGADTVMFSNAANAQDISKLGLHVHYFAAMALRTLLFGMRRLSMAEFLSWKQEYDSAKKTLVGREQICLDVARKIETSISLLGATGVEDLLQDGVRECIDQLVQAGVNVWMLTGDKDETAISVAHMCGLIGEKSKIIIIKGKTKQDCLDEIANARRKLKREGVWVPGVASRSMSLVINGEALELLLADSSPSPPQASGVPVPKLGAAAALPIGGDEVSARTLPSAIERLRAAQQLDGFGEDATTNAAAAIQDSLSVKSASGVHGAANGAAIQTTATAVQPPITHSRSSNPRVASRHTSTRPSIADSTASQQQAHELFMELATQCSSVVACRLSPMQKAQVVGLMKSARGAPLTLAVGDGGNDVSMIQEAHVGVGIYGHEGMQAVRAADFAIATFQHLSRLLLVHGRWNHRRVALVILYSFYKNMALIMTLFIYSQRNAYSGQTLYESYLMVGWNVAYTLLPIFVLGIADEDIRDRAVLRYPFVYRTSLRHSELSIQKLSIWVTNALMHSILVFFFTIRTLENVASLEGRPNGLFVDGTAVYGALVITVNLKAAMVMQPVHRWTRAHYTSLLGGFGAFLIFVAAYSQAYHLFPTFDVFGDFSGIATILFGEAKYWMLLLFSSVASLVPDFAISYIRHMYVPSSDNIIQEIDAGLVDEMDGDAASTLASQALNGLTDPLLSEEDAQSTRALNVQPSVHPLTLEFMGEQHQQLEHEYELTFAFRERVRVLLCLRILAVVIPVYALYEIFVERETGYYRLRIGFLVCDLLYMRVVRTRFFLEHYEAAILVPFCAIGMALTITISDTGVFAAALYPVVLFVVIRVKFLYALMLSVYNIAFYLLAGELGLKLTQASDVAIQDLVLFGVYMVFVIAFGAFSCYSLQITMRRDFLQSRSLLLEQRRSTQILKNMLPEHVVQRMQKGETLISEDEKDVTILFCDIADFASFVTRFSPVEVVTLLDRVYSLFDQMCQKHGVRKMETVGKTYMACAGLQGKDRGREAALRAVSMAIDMLTTLDRCRASNGNGVKLRIGIHSGRVISGLVGMKKQQFSLFGDTVNTASRMQSTGITGRCQVSHVTYKKLVGHFRFEERQIQVKGKGSMTTYMLGEPLTELARMAVAGQLEHIVKRDSIVVSELAGFAVSALGSTAAGALRAFDPDFLLATRQKLMQNARKRWARYDIVRLLFGSPPMSLEDLGTPNPNLGAISGVEQDMLTEIHYAQLRFKEDEMEHKYLESTLSDRVEGARTTLTVVAFYALFAVLRDITYELLRTRVVTHPVLVEGIPPAVVGKRYETSSETIAIIMVSRLVYGTIAAMMARQARNILPEYNKNQLRNVLLSIYVIGLVAFTLPQGLLWRRCYLRFLSTSTSYVHLCLDTVLAMFLVSNGGSILHRQAVVFNIIALGIVTTVTVICLSLYLEEVKSNKNTDEYRVELAELEKKVYGYNEKFQTMYPIVLTYLSVIANIYAAFSVEFFTRRQIWLKTRTQLETMNADRLLYQMLPAAVVMRLKEGETVCDQHQQVGILFSDIKGFTTIASQANPAQVVNILASLFCAFDKLTEKHGVFKMQTIGDAYVIVSGLPYVDMSLGPVMGAPGASVATASSGAPSIRSASSRVIPMSVDLTAMTSERQGQLARRSTLKHKFQMHIRSHIRDLLAMARDMHKEVRKVNDPNTGEPLQMRIGIHIGNIIGGVIGTTTLRYDMWGPDALTANELESNSLPEQTLVSPVVMEVVKGMPDIKCTFYKKINFTNVSMMDTYLVDLSAMMGAFATREEHHVGIKMAAFGLAMLQDMLVTTFLLVLISCVDRLLGPLRCAPTSPHWLRAKAAQGLRFTTRLLLHLAFVGLTLTPFTVDQLMLRLRGMRFTFAFMNMYAREMKFATRVVVASVALNDSLNELFRLTLHLEFQPSLGDGSIESASLYIHNTAEEYSLFQDDVLFRRTMGFKGPKAFNVTVDPSTPPNVVVLVVESFRYSDSLYIAGDNQALPTVQHNVSLTPNFDRWAKRGVAFRNFWSSWQTSRSVESILFGQVPFDDVFDTGTSTGRKKVHLEGMPQLFKAKGYETTFSTGCRIRYDQWDKFMPSHGFEHVLGVDEIKRLAEQRENLTRNDWKLTSQGGKGRGFFWGVHDNVALDVLGDMLIDKTVEQQRQANWYQKSSIPDFSALYKVADIVGVPPGGFLQTGVGRSLLRAVPYGERPVWSNNPMLKLAVVRGHRRLQYDRRYDMMQLHDAESDPKETTDLYETLTDGEKVEMRRLRSLGRRLNRYFRVRRDRRCLTKVKC